MPLRAAMALMMRSMLFLMSLLRRRAAIDFRRHTPFRLRLPFRRCLIDYFAAIACPLHAPRFFAMPLSR